MNENADPADIFRQESAELLEQLEQALLDLERQFEGDRQRGIIPDDQQIASRLHLSPKTIETHREKVKQKLNLKSSAELNRRAVQWVLERGWSSTAADGGPEPG